jgi:hypothetical protein
MIEKEAKYVKATQLTRGVLGSLKILSSFEEDVTTGDKHERTGQ